MLFCLREPLKVILKWGNEHATKEQMEQALRIAQAEEFVSRLPKGLQTEVKSRRSQFFRRTKTASDHCPRIGGTAEDFDFWTIVPVRWTTPQMQNCVWQLQEKHRI